MSGSRSFNLFAFAMLSASLSSLLGPVAPSPARADHPQPMSACNAHISAVEVDGSGVLNLEGVSANCDEVRVVPYCWKTGGRTATPDASGNWVLQFPADPTAGSSCDCGLEATFQVDCVRAVPCPGDDSLPPSPLPPYSSQQDRFVRCEPTCPTCPTCPDEVVLVALDPNGASVDDPDVCHPAGTYSLTVQSPGNAQVFWSLDNVATGSTGSSFSPTIASDTTVSVSVLVDDCPPLSAGVDINICGDEPTCQNGIVEPPETCDGNCPTSCDDGDACTLDRLFGSPADCNVTCEHVERLLCQSGDACCPSGCSSLADSDCPPRCGNGIVEPPAETCDGNCPASCDDGDDCTVDTRSGLPSLCNVTCSFSNISGCDTGDGGGDASFCGIFDWCCWLLALFIALYVSFWVMWHYNQVPYAWYVGLAALVVFLLWVAICQPTFCAVLTVLFAAGVVALAVIGVVALVPGVPNPVAVISALSNSYPGAILSVLTLILIPLVFLAEGCAPGCSDFFSCLAVLWENATGG